MAIHIPIKCVERNEEISIFEFSRAENQGYTVIGKIGLDFKTGEIVLLELRSPEEEKFFVRAGIAIQKRYSSGTLIDEFSYSA